MTTNLKEREQSKTYIKLNALTGQKLIPSGGFRGGRAGRAPPPPPPPKIRKAYVIQR